MKRILTMLLCLCLALSLVPAAFAEETTAPTEVVRAPDECGENLKWNFADGTLTITGEGAMDDYLETDAPWDVYQKDIETLVLDGVTYIGAEAFADFDALKEIDFGEDIKEIGTKAFYSCDGLTKLEFPRTFKIFGESAFQSCKNLKEIHSQGSFPSFRLNCLWDCYLTIYFPVERPWSVSLIEELEGAFKGRIEFLASDGTDPYVPTEPTTEPEETEAPTTEAPTEAPTTEAPTEVTEPVTEAPTVPATNAPVETQEPESEAAPTEPAQEPEDDTSAIKLVLIAITIAVVISVLLALILILRKAGRRGKYEY